VLAVALAAVLLGLLGTALHVYLTSVNAGRGDVEQSQLARAILSRIAEDLRAAVRQVEQDVSSIGSVAESTSFDVGSLDDESGAGGGSGSGSGSGGSGSSAATDIASSLIPPPVVGVYGNQNQLQVDISRIPRFDELDALLQTGAAPSGHASDLRTVAYYLEQGQYVDESSLAATAQGDGQLARSGLMRRELDRAAAAYSAQAGGSLLASEGGVLLAPEVTWIEFGYFDGLETWTEWDSTERGGVPMAVEVRIWLRPPRVDEEQQTVGPAAAPTGPAETDEMYRVVVHLPAAEATSVDSGSTGTSSGATTGGASTSGSGTGGT
jgi:hypothetical protein